MSVMMSGRSAKSGQLYAIANQSSPGGKRPECIVETRNKAPLKYRWFTDWFLPLIEFWIGIIKMLIFMLLSFGIYRSGK